MTSELVAGGTGEGVADGDAPRWNEAALDDAGRLAVPRSSQPLS